MNTFDDFDHPDFNGDLPQWAADRMHTTVAFHFDWKDRLKIFLGGRMLLTTRTLTENRPGHCESASRPTVHWPWYSPRKILSQVTEEDVEHARQRLERRFPDGLPIK